MIGQLAGASSCHTGSKCFEVLHELCVCDSAGVFMFFDLNVKVCVWVSLSA